MQLQHVLLGKHLQSYQHQFHSLGSKDKCSQYLRPYFMFDPSKQRDTMGKLTTSSIHNEMDEPISNRPKNVHCVELKDIIMLIVHTSKLTTNIFSIFQFYVCV